MSASHLQVGILGGGWPGQRHAEGFAASGVWNVAAIADTDPGRCAPLAHNYDAAALASSEELFAHPALDAVVIALPTFLHHPMVLSALESGKHVLCEKPPAVNATEAAAMVEAAGRLNSVLSFGLQRRAMTTSVATHALIAEGALGEIYHARAVYTRPWGAPTGAGGWFRDPARAGGGPLIDIGIHVLDLAWYLMGRPQPVAVSSVCHHRAAETDPLESAAFGLLRFEGGRSIQLEASWILPQGDDALSVELFGTGAGALVERDRVTVTRVGKNGIDQATPPVSNGWPDSFIAPFRTQAQHFAAAVRGEGPPMTTAEDGLTLMRLIDAMYMSAREQREIRLT
ncbi:MAG: Gfo/Idh/MocA family oxidoreductase [Pseudomonadota bacterium]